jgi:hypothetical protein
LCLLLRCTFRCLCLCNHSTQVDLLSLDDLPLRVSFRTDKANRPRWANQMWLFNTLGEMLNLDDLQLTLPGLEREGIREARSGLLGHAVKALQAQALLITLNVFRCGLGCVCVDGLGWSAAAGAQLSSTRPVVFWGLLAMFGDALHSYAGACFRCG